MLSAQIHTEFPHATYSKYSISSKRSTYIGHDEGGGDTETQNRGTKKEEGVHLIWMKIAMVMPAKVQKEDFGGDTQ